MEAITKITNILKDLFFYGTLIGFITKKEDKAILEMKQDKEKLAWEMILTTTAYSSRKTEKV